MDDAQAQIALALCATSATLATLVYVLFLAWRYARVRGLLFSIALWLLSFAGGWASWLLHMVGAYPIQEDFPGLLMFFVMLMLLPLFAGVAYWITQEIARR